MQFSSSSPHRSRLDKVASFTLSMLDPRTWLQVLRLVHYYSYAHARERGRVRQGAAIRLSPNVSLRNGERIEIGDGSLIGERSCLWAGDTSGRIRIGRNVLGAPDVFITASNYGMQPGKPMVEQPQVEADVVIGDDVWLGARVVVVAGVTIGDGSIVGAGSVVTRSLPPGSIAVGAPARVVRTRDV